MSLHILAFFGNRKAWMDVSWVSYWCFSNICNPRCDLNIIHIYIYRTPSALFAWRHLARWGGFFSERRCGAGHGMKVDPSVGHRRAGHGRSQNQWEFQDPKMEVLYHIRPYFGGDIPWNLGLTYIGLIYGRYLQFRFLKFPLIKREF